MTGHGEARCQQDGLAVAVEVRTINSRYFKLSIRGGDGAVWLEPQIESIVRKFVRRGTAQISLKLDRQPTPDDYRLNSEVLGIYRQQLQAVYDKLHMAEAVPLEALLTLPGVVNENAGLSASAETDWPIIKQALADALKNLEQMRVEEGRAMAEDLQSNCKLIAGELDQIEKLAPQVVQGYRERLKERLNGWLTEHEAHVSDADLVREVGVFAERADISEETVRLRSHLEQFDSIMSLKESSGRKLEFLTQEMFREANTIGSKANNTEISRHVIDIKAAIERMREMIQNVE